ncbi:MAG: hypothetical protein EHM58_17925 [Ignavibacteriae bacterium]|nr:MAG: hypothetical protein EHM58_17925 [Ignavibacteriota bacterium]
MTIKIPISTGELIDKITILEIKTHHIKEGDKLSIIYNELKMLYDEFEKLLDSIEKKKKKLLSLKNDLEKVNSTLWEIEDKIRILEAKKDFTGDFVELARNVYLYNDKRSELKKKINILTDSHISEIKQYPNYKDNEQQ